MTAIYNYEIGTLFTGTGTATSSAASAAVVGTASSFDTEFAAGYLIIIAGETRVVTSVADATHLTVTENFTTGSGGAVAYTGVNLVNVEDLGTPVFPPRSIFQEFSQMIELASGGVRGVGWTITTWNWGYLSQAQYQQMNTFCTGKSAEVYIRSRDDTETYNYYSCVMVWPEQIQRQLVKVLDFSISFQAMETIAIS